MRDSLGRTTITLHTRHISQLLKQTLAKALNMRKLLGKRFTGNGKSCAHAGDLMGCQGAGTQSGLMATAMDLGL